MAALLPRSRAAWTDRERLELEDGDFLDLAWRRRGNRRLAVLCHGLEGCMDAPYIRGMAESLVQAGWDVLAWNYRNCGPEPNRLPRTYHSGESGDLRVVVKHAAGGYEQLAVVGFSLGGNIALKYVGEAPLHPAMRAVVAVSAPIDLVSCARVLDGHLTNRLYQRRFLKTLVGKALAKARRFPGKIDPASVLAIRSIRDFDEKVTAPLHGFAGADDYWIRSSALPFISKITIPALLLSAANDPLLDAPSYPVELARELPDFHLEMPAWGGHLGFPGGARLRQPWLENRVISFLEEAMGRS